MRLLMLEVITEYKEMHILRVLVYFLNFLKNIVLNFIFTSSMWENLCSL